MTNANSIEAKTYFISYFIFIVISDCNELTDQSQTELAKAIAQNKGLTSLSIKYLQKYLNKRWNLYQNCEKF